MKREALNNIKREASLHKEKEERKEMVENSKSAVKDLVKDEVLSNFAVVLCK